jgi:hypothetical protein
MKAQVPSVVRPCQPLDFEAMYAIINDAAQAYRGVIPTDRWHDPYMPSEQSARLRKTVLPDLKKGAQEDHEETQTQFPRSSLPSVGRTEGNEGNEDRRRGI